MSRLILKTFIPFVSTRIFGRSKVRNIKFNEQMKVAKLLKISMGMLKLMSEYGVKVNDWKYVDVYYDFLNMRENKVKYRNAINILAEEKHISPRTLERIFKRLSRIVN